MSPRTNLLLLLLGFTIAKVQAESLLDRLTDEEMNEPLIAALPDSDTQSDAIAGPRSKVAVGTFRGQPILTRQKSVIIDNEGVPVPVRR